MAHDTYCSLTATKHTFSNDYDIVIDLGAQSTDTQYAAVLKEHASEIDALNYMASQGWELVSTSANVNLFVIRHILKKRA